MSGDTPDRSFSFLFRTDRGVIDRATWWRGTLPLLLVGAIATWGWLAVRPFTHDAVNQAPGLAVTGYVYLLVYAFLVLLLFVCEYNLSAKRFHARGKPGALAALLPLASLLTGTFAWYLPRSQGALPDWSFWPVLLALGLVAGWNAVELGLRAR